MHSSLKQLRRLRQLPKHLSNLKEPYFRRAVAMRFLHSFAQRYDAAVITTPILVTEPLPYWRKSEDQQLLLTVFRKERNSGDFNRLYFLFTQARRVIRSNIPGAFAELGVYRGQTAGIILAGCHNRTLHLFDTISGHPANEATQERDGDQYTNFIEDNPLDDTSLESVSSYLGKSNNIQYHVGYFPDTAEGIEVEQYAFVHIDCDHYKSILAGLEYFYPKLAPEGSLLCHDYGIFAGAKQAIDEFFADKVETPVALPDGAGSVLIIRAKATTSPLLRSINASQGESVSGQDQVYE